MLVKWLNRFFTAPKVPEKITQDGGEHDFADTEKVMRIGTWSLGLGMGFFLLWAVFVPLGEGVPTHGTVTIDTKRKIVQPSLGGTIKEVLVKEGQFVEKDEILIRLSDAQAKADFESSRQRYYNFRAMENRLLTEQLGQNEINFHADLIEASKDDPVLAQNIEIQKQLLASKRRSLAAALSSIQETIKGEEAQVAGYGVIAQNRRSQLKLLQDEYERAKPLIDEGYMPRNRQYELERTISDITSGITEAMLNQSRSRQAMLDMKQRLISIQSDYNKEVETQLSDIRREVEPEAERLKVAIKQLEATKIKAPVAGQVVGINLQTVGGVVQPGQKLMDVVPLDEKLLLETRIETHLVDRVHVGDKVDVRFSNFAHTPQLVVEGVIDSISSDVISEPETQMPPYYLARITLTPEGLAKLGKRQMHAGMQVEVVVKTGSRTLLTYLLHPLIKRFAASMTEE